MMLELYLPSPEATESLGRRLARLLEPGDVVALYGGLGAGKTTLVRGLVKALCPDAGDVPSPTYTLVQTYEAPDFDLWHYDLYRLKSEGELMELGWDDTHSGVVLAEWPERAGERLPTHRLDLTLTPDGDGRRARLEARGEHWQERLHGF